MSPTGQANLNFLTILKQHLNQFLWEVEEGSRLVMAALLHSVLPPSGPSDRFICVWTISHAHYVTPPPLFGR